MLPDGVHFCPECGTRAGMPAAAPAAEVAPAEAPVAEQAPVTEQASAAEAPVAEAPVEAEPDAPKKKKSKKKTIILICVAAVAVLAIVAALLWFFVFREDTRTLERAYVDDNGVAHFLYDNGKVLKVDDNVYQGYMTANRKYVIIEQEDGTLYFTDEKLSLPTTIHKEGADESLIIEQIYNDYLIYSVENDDAETYYLYSFEKSSAEIIYNSAANGTLDDLCYHQGLGGEGAFLIAYGGEIRVWSCEYPRFYNYASYGDLKVELLDVDAKGETFVYATRSDSGYSVYAYIKNEQQTLMQNVVGSTVKGAVSPDGKRVVAYVTSAFEGNVNKLAIYQGDACKVYELDEPIQGMHSLTGQGIQLDKDAARQSGIFVNVGISTFTDPNAMQKLYYLDFESGKSTCVCINIAELKWASEDRLIYVGENQHLIFAQINIKSGNLVNQKTISYAVGNKHPTFSTEKSNYIFYTEPSAEGPRLYAYSIKQEQSVLAAAVVYSDLLYVSPDGNTVYYWTDTTDDIGTLNRYNAKSGKSEVVAENVLPMLLGLVNSQLSLESGGELQSSGFFYAVYKDESFDFVYYNGKKSETVVNSFNG
ncbi:MAG: hypothetical protein IKD28_01520 [Clostridia bacterium]|nr:hypothetical protein [Clostridia bacterium]